VLLARSEEHGTAVAARSSARPRWPWQAWPCLARAGSRRRVRECEWRGQEQGSGSATKATRDGKVVNGQQAGTPRDIKLKNNRPRTKLMN